MRRVFKKGIAAALAAAMVVTLAPVSAGAAKKPSVKKTASVEVGKTTKIKVKNGNKKAKVTWKTSNKKVAKITKKTTKGNKATATVKGVKKGKAKITASYKLGKKKAKKLVCTVTVGKTTAVATPTPAVPVVTPAPTQQGGGTTTTTPPASDPTPTPTPKATPTPSPRPKNKNLDAWQVADGAKFTIDGKVESGEGWEDSTSNDLLTDITKTSGVRKPNASDVDAAKEIPVTEAKANIMWSGKDLYVLMKVQGDSDNVIIYYDENSKGTKDTATKIEIPVGDGEAKSSNAAYAVEAKSVKADGSYVLEAKITGKTDLVVDGNARIDIQMNKGDVSVNFYDTRSAMVYNEETKTFELGDAEVKVGENAELMGPVTLLGQMPAATSAFFTEFGAQILEASGIESAEFEKIPPEKEGDPEKVTNTKAVKYVDAKFWTDTYTEHGAPSIEFSKVNTGEKVYINNPDKITLGTPVLDGDGNAVLDSDGVPTFTTSREQAQAYIIWDDEYLYVMFDVNDPDISPANDEHFTTDSTELFLDEDGLCSAYDAEKDAVQLRIDVANNVFSSNDAGAGNYAVVGHAVGYKHADGSVDDKIDGATGYQTQYIIKLNSKHAPNTVLGMELQINDCYTSDVDSSGNAFTDADGNPVNGALRAGTITAYDTTNSAYENPERFERLKLIKKGVTEGPGDPTDKPSDPSEKPADNRLDLSTINITDGSTIEVKDDGSAVIACAGNYTGGITIDIPAVLADGAKKIIVAVDAEPSSGQFHLEFDGDETETKYNWGADTYDDTTFDVTGKKPKKLVLNSQDNNVFTIKYIEVQK